MFKFRRIFMFFFIVTLVGSFFTFKIMVKAYSINVETYQSGLEGLVFSVIS